MGCVLDHSGKSLASRAPRGSVRSHLVLELALRAVGMLEAGLIDT